MHSMTTRFDSLRVNSATGKQVLSLVRNGDFAHPGEADAVKMVFKNVTLRADRLTLDVGCGLGGTADLVQRLGVGKVTGIDIDVPTIEYAKVKYPHVAFECGAAEELSSKLTSRFELIYLFNALYTFKDQERALREVAKVAAQDAQLIIFDYSVSLSSDGARRFASEYKGSIWNPLELEAIASLLRNAGWNISHQVDISLDYRRWYAELLERIHSKEAKINQQAGRVWFEYVVEKYTRLYNAINQGDIGGVIIYANFAG